MGWGTTIETSIYLSRKTLKTVREIEEEIENLKREIVEYETTFLTYMTSNPENCVPKECVDISAVDHIRYEMKSQIEDYKETLYKLHLTELLLDEVQESGEEKIIIG